MAKKEVDVAEKPDMPVAEEKKAKEVTTKKKKKERGMMSRIWHVLFGSRSDDFERRLERISKEEATILSRMRRRQQRWGRVKRHLIFFSVLLELMAVGYAIMTAASAENWKKRAFRVLPMFLLPLLSSITYITLRGFFNICERKDQKSLEKLRAERQAKIDELKEKNNYYITQQLIQRYDTDPAAKAAAATVLASKLGAESGIKLYVGDDSKLHDATARSNDVELVQQPGGLRNRKQPNSGLDSAEGNPALHHHNSALLQQMGAEIAEHNQPLHVDHYQKGQSNDYSGGWLARIAALLVGEDPTQCYALICGNCHMHNGLASKEDFPYVTYICPHCHAVNGPRKDDRIPGVVSQTTASFVTSGNINTTNSASQSPRGGSPDCEGNEQTAQSSAVTDGNDNTVTTKED